MASVEVMVLADIVLGQLDGNVCGFAVGWQF